MPGMAKTILLLLFVLATVVYMLVEAFRKEPDRPAWNRWVNRILTVAWALTIVWMLATTRLFR
jgi:hypothetical protein